MKLKNILYFLSILTVSGIDAKNMAARGGYNPGVTPPAGNAYDPNALANNPGQQTPVSSKNFQSLLQEIRRSNRANILKADGTFLPGFEQKIEAANLDSMLKTCLLEAAVALHLPLSGTDELDIEKIKKVNELIENQYENSDKNQLAIVKRDGTVRTPFYNDETNLMDEEYLMKEVKNKLSQDKKNNQIVSELLNEYRPYMLAEWKNNNITATTKLLKDLQQQIKNAIISAIRERFEKLPFDQMTKPAEDFVNKMIDYKRDSLQNAFLTQTKDNITYAKNFINDILTQLSQKFPNTTQEQAIRMIISGVGLPLSDSASLIIAIVRDFDAEEKVIVSRSKGKSPVAPMNSLSSRKQEQKNGLEISYTPVKLKTELNIQDDRLFANIMREAAENQLMPKKLLLGSSDQNNPLAPPKPEPLSISEDAQTLVNNQRDLLSDISKRESSSILFIAKELLKKHPEMAARISNDLSGTIREAIKGLNESEKSFINTTITANWDALRKAQTSSSSTGIEAIVRNNWQNMKKSIFDLDANNRIATFRSQNSDATQNILTLARASIRSYPNITQNELSENLTRRFSEMLKKDGYTIAPSSDNLSTYINNVINVNWQLLN